MRVFITSTPDELELHQTAAVDIVRELGHEPVLRDRAGRRGLDPVMACGRQVALADVVLAIVGWRRGRVPPVTSGGDGLRPWSYWEVQSAFKHEVPVVALLAGEAFEPDSREEAPEAHAVVADLRGELARLGAVFEGEDDFRRLARVKLGEAERASRSGAPPTDLPPLKLRRYPAPELPTRPYPLLLPYSHPDLMAGRDEDLADLCRILGRPVTVVGLHAASGTGKSSLLAGGLVPTLRAGGRPVAFVRHPAEAGLAAHLLGDLVETSDSDAAIDTSVPSGGSKGGKDSDARTFVDRLVDVRRLADGVAPVLVVDQFEDVLKDGAEAARAALGMLLATSAQRLPGPSGPPCRWLLAYRQEFHGKLVSWLEDVLCDARHVALKDSAVDTLPHDLSGPARFVAFALRPLATPTAESDDPTEASTRVFLDAIEKPLKLMRSGSPLPLGEGLGVRAFPWRFAPGHAERLARAFAEARLRRPKAPLVPELQVVLAHLLEQAGEPMGGDSVTVDVPEEPAELIDQALEDHLRRALDCAFPPGPPRGGRAFPKSPQRTANARVARTRALLALRELADARGRQGEGRPITDLARAIGRDGRGVLEKLATAQTRLVLLERPGQLFPGQSEEQIYVLSHDRMAEVIVRLVDDGGAYAGLGVDSGLLGLWRFVALQRQLFISGEVEQSTEIPKDHFSGIERHADALLWDEEGRRWWAACGERCRLNRRRKVVRRTVQAAVLVLLTVLVGTWTDQYVKRKADLKTIMEGEPEVAFEALARLSAEPGVKPEELRHQVRKRERPFDVLERGLGGVEEDRGPALLRVAELLLPLIAEDPEDPVRIASTVWALDFFTGPALRDQALVLRDEILKPLRAIRPPPPWPKSGSPAADNPDWVDIPAGTFWMGAGPEDGRDAPNMRSEKPRHQVVLSAFRIMTHEVTNAEYRRLFADHQGEGDLPAGGITWYEAYTYAAWLGGRLPTEPESEYAARAGCAHAFCKRDGSKATLDEVAWWIGNSVHPETGEPSVKAVMLLEPNPWGLWDVYGNVLEWNASWYGRYTEALERDPPGPTDTSFNERTLRAGSAWESQKWVAASGRWSGAPNTRLISHGLRVVIAKSLGWSTGSATRKPRSSSLLSGVSLLRAATRAQPAGSQ